jgi:glycosyltransferase involved in cell wall biosynthesis
MRAFPRVLFVLKHIEDPYGGYGYEPDCPPSNLPPKKPISSGLYNSARFIVDMLKTEGVPVKLVTVHDNSTIHREIVAFQADVVIIEAFWVVPDKFDELQAACPNVTFVVRNHSETPFLASDGIAFDWMLRYVQKPNVVLAANSHHMYTDSHFLVKAANPQWESPVIDAKVVMLPNYYPVGDTEVLRVDDHKTIDIGCFGAIRPLKNHMTQAVAALRLATRLGKSLRFHINGSVNDIAGDQILKNLSRLFSHYPQHMLVLHPWMIHAQFKDLLSTMDIVTQVSFSETFNIVAADAVVQGVAVVTSDEVTWASRCFYADPTDSHNISEIMEKAWFIKRKAPALNLSLRGLKNYNRKAVHHWLDYLQTLSVNA